jgi:hypothetical protein
MSASVPGLPRPIGDKGKSLAVFRRAVDGKLQVVYYGTLMWYPICDDGVRKMRDIKKKELSALILILSVSAVIANGYFNRVDRLNFGLRLELHNQIIAGTAPSPYRYRILVPFVGEALTRALSTVLPAKISFLLAYAIYDLLAVFFLLAILFYWLSTWFNEEQALIGVLFVAGTMPIALQNHYFQPWSLFEAGLFTAALFAIQRKRYWLLASLVALASLNRETAVFIPLAFLLTIDTKSLLSAKSKNDWKPIVLFGGLLIIWAVVFWGLRYFLGSTPHVETIRGLLARNTTKGKLFQTLVNGGLFLGGFWAFAFLGFRYAPPFIRRVALIIPIYLITVLVWGMWHEVRLLMPLYPVLVPLGLSFLYLRK